MNKHTRLLAVLNDVFGMENILKSQFRKVGQDFDEKTNEHVFYIEYRVRGLDRCIYSFFLQCPDNLNRAWGQLCAKATNVSPALGGKKTPEQLRH